MLVVKNLVHYYKNMQNDNIVALNDVSLRIKKGEFVAIVGSNGSGKSTLAKHFNALLLPSSGTCLVAGMDSTNEQKVWEIRKKVGMVFQNPDNQIVGAIVEEDVAFGPENLGVSPVEIRARVENVLSQVNMLDYRKHAPHKLSGGQKQRIAIAGVLAIEPECMVLDEPTAMLDPQGRAEVMATVLRLNKEKNMTIVYITHFMEEARKADRVIVMNDGKIVLEGTPKEVFVQKEIIENCGLEVPIANNLAHILKDKGLNINTDVISSEELAKELCQLN